LGAPYYPILGCSYDTDRFLRRIISYFPSPVLQRSAIQIELGPSIENYLKELNNSLLVTLLIRPNNKVAVQTYST
jgi:hypothetical protein